VPEDVTKGTHGSGERNQPTDAEQKPGAGDPSVRIMRGFTFALKNLPLFAGELTLVALKRMAYHLHNPGRQPAIHAR
jgi:hypothetical protein